MLNHFNMILAFALILTSQWCDNVVALQHERLSRIGVAISLNLESIPPNAFEHYFCVCRSPCRY